MKPGHRLSSYRICLGVVLSFAACATHAQKDAAPPPPPKEKPAIPSAEIDRVNQSLSDLELLRPLLPLNLTQKQVDGIVAAMKEIAAEWREVKKQDDAALVALGPDIDKAHTAVLTGVPIPKEFDAKIIDAQKASANRYNVAHTNALRRLLTLLTGSLKDAQKDKVDAWSVEQFGGRRIPKKYQAKPAAAPKEEVQGLAIAALIEHSLLLDRTLILLQQFKSETAATPDPAKSDAPPAAPAK